MGRKCKVISVIIGFGVLMCVIVYSRVCSKNYVKILKNSIVNKSNMTVQDVFDFEFDRGYVFSESYLDGNGLVKEYGLDISIEEVGAKSSDYIRRIIFVNEIGEYVYEFSYEVDEILFLTNEIIVYPYTEIINKGFKENGVLYLDFQNYGVWKKD